MSLFLSGCMLPMNQPSLSAKINPLSIEYASANFELRQALVTIFTDNNITIQDNHYSHKLVITDYKCNNTAINNSRLQQQSRARLSCQLTFKLLDAKQQVLIPARTISCSRSYTRDSLHPFNTEVERDMLTQELHYTLAEDLVTQINLHLNK